MAYFKDAQEVYEVIGVTVALPRGQIKAKGPVAEILRLVPPTKPVYPRYEAELEAQGREDPVGVD